MALDSLTVSSMESDEVDEDNEDEEEDDDEEEGSLLDAGMVSQQLL